jgi:hypothetical protein
MNNAQRLPEQKEESIGLIIGTYQLEGLIWQRPCNFDQIITQVEVDDGFFSVVEYDLECAPDCEPELMRVRAYKTAGEFKRKTPTPISAGLQEVFSQYLQDDPQRWNEAKSWLHAMGESISVTCHRRAA